MIKLPDFRNLERGIWFLFLFALPWQTRWIFWQADAQFIEWRSASVYLTDILFVALIVWAAIRNSRNWTLLTVNWKLRPWDWALMALVGAGFVSVFGAEHRGVALYGAARLVQGVLLYAYVRWYVPRRFDGGLSLIVFVLGALAQGILGLAQFLAQHDMGLRAVGETILLPEMRGVAVFYDLAGAKTLRAYGTFPHPNVLAMELALAGAALAYLYLRHSAATVRRAWAVWFSVVSVLSWAMLATFSRTVIASAGAAMAVPFIALMAERVSRGWPGVSVLRRRARNLFLVTLAASLAFAGVFWPQVLARAGISPHEEAVQLRAFYNAIALDSGEGLFGVNWTGVGIGNFVSWLMRANPHLPSWQYQPAHDLYLLVYSELGVLGLAVLVCFLFFLLKALIRSTHDEPLVRWGLLSIAGLALFAAAFDHFFWTLQQGRMMWWMLWGVVAAYTETSTE